MMGAPKILAKFSDADRQQLQRWLAEFQSGWTESRLADCLANQAPGGHPLRLPLLTEMVKIDLDKQWRLHQRPLVERYLHAYPELGTVDTVSAELLQAEYEVRRRHGDAVTLADYEQRFPRQAGALKQLLSTAKHPTASRETAGHGPTTSAPDASSGSTSLPEQFGRYRIIKKLGGGGMGSVYLAEDTELARTVALKVPHFSAADGTEVLERFKREARAAAKLAHANLCPVYDVGELDGIPYFVMAHIEGRTLGDVLADYGRVGRFLTQDWCASVVIKVARALQEAHARDIVHRDLKPANIMLRLESAKKLRDDPVVMDFGLARQTKDRRLTGGGMVMGTLPYMPPEALRDAGTAMGPQGDIYSLGVILYEILTNRLPFDAPGMEVVLQIAAGDPPRPSTLRPDLDPRIEAVCLKAMARDPADRFASMAEFAAALAEARRGQTPIPSTATRPPAETALAKLAETNPTAPRPSRGSKSKAVKKSKRNPVPAVAAGIGAVLILGITAYLALPRSAAPEPRTADKGGNTETSPAAIRPVIAAAPAEGFLQLEGLLPGDEWTVDDKEKVIVSGPGSRAASLSLVPGNHHVSVTRPDHRPWTQDFSIQSGLTIKVDARPTRIAPVQGRVRIVGLPPRVDILLDGRRWIMNSPREGDSLTIEIAPGSHEIIIQAEGFRQAITRLDVKADETQTVDPHLVRLPQVKGTLAIDSLEPADAEVFLDGEKVADGTQRRGQSLVLNVVVGKHTLSFWRKGYKTENQTYDVAENQRVSVKMKLSPPPPPPPPPNLSALLKPGSTWRGRYSFLDGKNDGDIVITIKSRDGNKFEGTHDAVSGKAPHFVRDIKGTVEGNEMRYHSVADPKGFKVTGVYKRDVLEMTFVSWNNKVAKVKARLDR